MWLTNLNSDDDGLKVRCNIAYQTDTKNSFFGGRVTSGDMVLKIARITEFTVSNDGPISGETITLTCVAAGETAPTFKFTTSGQDTMDSTFYEEVKSLEVSSDGTTHSAKYEIKTLAPSVMRNGRRIVCTVSNILRTW